MKHLLHQDKRLHPGPGCLPDSRGNETRHLQKMSIPDWVERVLPSTDLHVKILVKGRRYLKAGIRAVRGRQISEVYHEQSTQRSVLNSVSFEHL